MDILKNTDAMGKRIFADLEKINFIRTSTSAEETRAANIIKDELAKEGMEAVIEEFMVETADIHKVSLKALGKEWEIKGYRRSGSTPPEGLTAEFAYVQQGNDIDLYDKKGKIVLVNSGRLNEEVYEKLVRYGVAGFLTWNGNVSDVREDTDLGERELRYWALRYGTIPGGVLRAIDAMELVKGEPETVTFTLIQDDVTRPSRNVVLQIKGTEDTNENITCGMEGSRVNGHLEAGRRLHEAKKCIKDAFAVIGKEGSTLEGQGFIQSLWADANAHFAQVQPLAKKDKDGNLVGIWGVMSDFSRLYQPWEENFSKGLYLAGVECLDEAQAPEGWTKWNIPGYEYLCAKVETENTFSKVLDYMQKNKIPLVGAIQDFSCPKSGKDYMLFPIRKL